jgi:hypothetical protein
MSRKIIPQATPAIAKKGIEPINLIISKFPLLMNVKNKNTFCCVDF